MIILPASTPQQLAQVRQLFVEYAQGLGVDLQFQGFEAELAGLPGKYAPPDGALLLAVDGEGAGEPAGCVALRALGDPAEKMCEMKRLYVRPQFRGRRVGRLLADAILTEAARLGYRGMRLDTLRTLTEAMGLYRALGFVEIPAYYDNPIPGVVYWEKRFGYNTENEIPTRLDGY